MRILEGGGRVVAASDAFVYHKGGGSFADAEPRYLANRALFDARWDALYRELHAKFAARDPLQPIRERLFEGTTVAGALWRSRPETSLSYKAWRALGHVRRGNHRLLVERAREAAASAATRLWRQPASVATSALRDASLAPEDQPLAFPTPEFVRALPRGRDRLRVIFLLLDAPLSGGVLQIRQIANRLILEGHDALIATVAREEMFRRLGLLSQPLVFRDEAQLIELLPEADVVVATHWRTAWAWLPRLARRPRCATVYYVQDFEADFYPPSLPEHARALESYSRAPHLVTTSGWLVQRLAEHGFAAAKIPCGIDLGVFYPHGGRSPDAPFTLTAVARPDPDEARRGFAELLAACEQVYREDPSIRFEFFGCAPEAMPHRVRFPYVHRGVLSTPESVALHLSRCDLLVDPSRFQAFGRPGLEAMACGTATVLPREGGIAEYAQDGVNTISFAGGDSSSLARAILRARRDPALRADLVRQGLATASRFDHRAEGRRHLELYRAALAAAPE
jgi:glycosyltransferase involved in cell wall biosynthesis